MSPAVPISRFVDSEDEEGSRSPEPPEEPAFELPDTAAMTLSDPHEELRAQFEDDASPPLDAAGDARATRFDAEAGSAAEGCRPPSPEVLRVRLAGVTPVPQEEPITAQTKARNVAARTRLSGLSPEFSRFYRRQSPNLRSPHRVEGRTYFRHRHRP